MTIFSSNAVFGQIKASDTKPVGTNNFFCFLQLNDTVDNAWIVEWENFLDTVDHAWIDEIITE